LSLHSHIIYYISTLIGDDATAADGDNAASVPATDGDDATPVPASDDDAANADGDDAAAATAADDDAASVHTRMWQLRPLLLLQHYPLLPFQLLRPLLIQQQYLL